MPLQWAQNQIMSSCLIKSTHSRQQAKGNKSGQPNILMSNKLPVMDDNNKPINLNSGRSNQKCQQCNSTSQAHHCAVRNEMIWKLFEHRDPFETSLKNRIIRDTLEKNLGVGKNNTGQKDRMGKKSRKIAQLTNSDTHSKSKDSKQIIPQTISINIQPSMTQSVCLTRKSDLMTQGNNSMNIKSTKSMNGQSLQRQKHQQFEESLEMGQNPMFQHQLNSMLTSKSELQNGNAIEYQSRLFRQSSLSGLASISQSRFKCSVLGSCVRSQSMSTNSNNRGINSNNKMIEINSQQVDSSHYRNIDSLKNSHSQSIISSLSLNSTTKIHQIPKFVYNNPQLQKCLNKAHIIHHMLSNAKSKLSSIIN